MALATGPEPQRASMVDSLSTMANQNTSSSPATIAQLLCGMALFGTATPLSKIVGEQQVIKANLQEERERVQ